MNKEQLSSFLEKNEEAQDLLKKSFEKKRADFLEYVEKSTKDMKTTMNDLFPEKLVKIIREMREINVNGYSVGAYRTSLFIGGIGDRYYPDSYVFCEEIKNITDLEIAVKDHNRIVNMVDVVKKNIEKVYYEIAEYKRKQLEDDWNNLNKIKFGASDEPKRYKVTINIEEVEK